MFELPASCLQTSCASENVLYAFTHGADGANPAAGLIFDAKGNLWGTTQVGGYTGNSFCATNGCGTVFELKH